MRGLYGRLLIRSTAIAAIMAATAAIPIGVAAKAAVGVTIARQDMSHALIALSQQTGKPVLFSPDVVRGKWSNPVNGTMAVERALAVLLRGSGLKAQVTASGGYLIVAAHAAAATGQTAALQAALKQHALQRCQRHAWRPRACLNASVAPSRAMAAPTPRPRCS